MSSILKPTLIQRIMVNIPALRLQQQQIAQTRFTTPLALVEYMGALQAQDFPMSKWAIGLRLPEATDATIEAALDAGQLVRTHVMRPTWHIVAGTDARWMLHLTGKAMKASQASRDRELGLDAELYVRATDLIVRALEGHRHLNRAEVMDALDQGGVTTNLSRAVHFMMYAEAEGIICNGIPRGKEQTYALLDEKVPPAPMLPKDEALATLATRYFTSHAPATLPDFYWWSGLSMPDAREGLNSIKSQLDSFEQDGKTYFMPQGLLDLPTKPSLFLLPAFDEYCVSYKDRSAVFDPAFHGTAITRNGIFKPIILVDGIVKGIWSRTIKKNGVAMEYTFFQEQEHVPQERLDKVALSFKNFVL